jgi:MFS family permease
MAVFGMLSSTWMKQNGFGSLLIGIISATYYLFQIFGAPAAEHWVRRFGVRGALALGLACASLSSPLFAFTRTPLPLALFRGGAGFGVGVCVTAAQTALIRLSPPERRGVISGLHALAFAVGLALGPLLGPPLYEIEPKLAAVFGGAVFAAGLATTLLAVPSGVAGLSRQRLPVFSKIAVPLHAILAYGFSEGALFSLYPPVLVQRGTSVRDIGLILATFVAGSIALTMPIARLGDRIGRQRVLAGCVFMGVLSILGFWTQNFALMIALAFVAGGSIGSSYAVTMALVADSLTPDELPSGMSLFTIATGIGCVSGPVVTGACLSLFGDAVLFVPTALIFAALLPRLCLRAPLPPSKVGEVAL